MMNRPETGNRNPDPDFSLKLNARPKANGRALSFLIAASSAN